MPPSRSAPDRTRFRVDPAFYTELAEITGKDAFTQFGHMPPEWAATWRPSALNRASLRELAQRASGSSTTASLTACATSPDMAATSATGRSSNRSRSTPAGYACRGCSSASHRTRWPSLFQAATRAR